LVPKGMSPAVIKGLGKKGDARRGDGGASLGWNSPQENTRREKRRGSHTNTGLSRRSLADRGRPDCVVFGGFKGKRGVTYSPALYSRADASVIPMEE